MDVLNLMFAVIGGLVATFGLLAGLVKIRIRVLSEPLLATLVGVAIGPALLGWAEPEQWPHSKRLLEETARIAVALAVMSIALRVKAEFLIRQHRALLALLGVGMLAMWLVSGLLTYLLFALPLWLAMLLGAVLTPTDPVVAGAIVQGEIAEGTIPKRVRHTLSAEAGANDGGAYPLVFLALLLFTEPAAQALEQWVLERVVWGVGLALAVGIAAGWFAGRAQRWAEQKGYPEESSVVSVTLGMTIAVLGLVKLLDGVGILAVFAAGVAFHRVADDPVEVQEYRSQEAVNRIAAFALFVLFGIMLPWEHWQQLGWPGVALAGGILLLRRLPVVLALKPLVGTLHAARDAWFVGWFGPFGAAAVYYATLAERETGEAVLWQLGSLVIFASVVAHGVTATPFTRVYGRAGAGRLRPKPQERGSSSSS